MADKSTVRFFLFQVGARSSTHIKQHKKDNRLRTKRVESMIAELWLKIINIIQFLDHSQHCDEQSQKNIVYYSRTFR